MAEERDITVAQSPIFDGVKFSIIPSTDLDHDQVCRDLESNGATLIPLRNGRLEELKNITHIVATHADFPDYQDAFDNYINIVKPSWVEMSLLKKKTTNPRQFSPDPSLFFSEVTMTCADIPDGDRLAIKGGLDATGGIWSPKITKLVTHIIALQMSNDMVQFALRKNFRCKIVLPHWFDDCMKLGRRIDEGPYLLPNPPYVNGHAENINDPHSLPSYDRIKGAVDPHPIANGGAGPDGLKRRKRLNVFKDKKVVFSSDLGLSSHLLQSLHDVIRSGGGDVVTTLDEATTLICQYRESSDFTKAYVEKLEIGNLSWLFYLMTYNTWTSPLRRLLHYPVPRNGIPGFDKTQISISVYTGEARIYLENLAIAAGADFTKTLKEDNTHLITAHMESEKCRAAPEWNINVVNHLWLEESYAAGAMKPLTNQRYTTFPPHTHLGQLIGQTQIDKDALDKQLLPDEGIVTMDVDGAAMNDHETGVEEQTVSAKTSKKQALKTRAESRTPATARFADGKENETPGTSGSRGAKQRALSSLKDAAKDIEQYQKESKRVGGVTHGRSKSGDGSKDVSKKRATPDPVEDDDEQQEEELDHGRKTKKAKTSGGKLPPIEHRLMVTKYDKWLEKPELEPKDRNKLRNLGIHITDSHADCTILCAPRIVRTRKFVAALASAPVVVNTEWLDSCIRNNKIPADGAYLLEDREQEDRLGLKLSEALERAERNNGKLLRGWQIFCAEGVTGGWETYKSIIEANGGMCTLYRGRSAMNASKRTFSRETQEDEAVADNQGEDEGDTLFLLSGESKKDREHWDKFRELARKEDMSPKIVRSDWVLEVAMSQKVVPPGKHEIFD